MTNQNPYNHPQMQQEQGMIPPQGPIMPRQIPMQNRAPRGWRERWMHRFGMDTAAATLRKGELTIPNWLIGSSIAFFFVTMFACWGVFGYVPAFDLWMVAAISVVLFFYGGSVMSKNWSHAGEKRFIRNVFVAGFIIRLMWVLYCYCSQNETYYIIWLLRKSGRGTAFQTVHAQIGRYLADHENDPGSIYRRTMRGNSENVHGTIDQPMWWGWRSTM